MSRSRSKLTCKLSLQSAICIALFIAISISSGFAQGPVADSSNGTPAASQEASNPDQTAILATSEAFTAAFEKADAKAIAAMWTADGEYIDDTGRGFVGRDAIEECYARLFTDHPGATIRIAIDSLRLVSPATAIEEGHAVVEQPDSGAASVGRYTVVHAKVDGKWFMASVRDTKVEPPASVQSAVDLEWLVGTWNAEEHGVQIQSVCGWSVGGRFLGRRYTTTQVDGTKTSGLQMIGWNPQGGHVQSWDFSPDGGHAVGVWSPTSDGWQAKVIGFTGGGVSTSAVNQLRRLDDNAYVWQSMRRSLGEIMLPDTDEVVIKRQPAK